MSCGEYKPCDRCDECKGCGCQCDKRALRAALESIQWGSCDGCGRHVYCPICKGQEPSLAEYDEVSPRERFGHKPDCPIGKALA